MVHLIRLGDIASAYGDKWQYSVCCCSNDGVTAWLVGFSGVATVGAARAAIKVARSKLGLPERTNPMFHRSLSSRTGLTRALTASALSRPGGNDMSGQRPAAAIQNAGADVGAAKGAIKAPAKPAK